jgi:hypothetical protein
LSPAANDGGSVRQFSALFTPAPRLFSPLKSFSPQQLMVADLSMILSENRFQLFGIMLLCLSMTLSENRFPLFGIML